MCFILLVSGCCFCISVIFGVICALMPLFHLYFMLFFCIKQVPVVAVTTAGCGIRALTAMYGSILGLQKLRVLDCISYISGSSGTTWWGIVLILLFGFCCVKKSLCSVLVSERVKVINWVIASIFGPWVTYERIIVHCDLSLTKRGGFIGSVNILNPMENDLLLLFTVSQKQHWQLLCCISD